MVNVSFSPYQQKIINVLDHQALFSFLAKVQDIILNIDILCKCRLVLKLSDIYRYLLNIVIIIASAVLLSPPPPPAQSTLKILLLTPPAPPPALSLVCRALTSAGAGPPDPPDPPTSLFSSHSILSGEVYLAATLATSSS